LENRSTVPSAKHLKLGIKDILPDDPYERQKLEQAEEEDKCKLEVIHKEIYDIEQGLTHSDPLPSNNKTTQDKEREDVIILLLSKKRRLEELHRQKKTILDNMTQRVNNAAQNLQSNRYKHHHYHSHHHVKIAKRAHSGDDSLDEDDSADETEHSFDDLSPTFFQNEYDINGEDQDNENDYSEHSSNETM